MVPRSMHTFDLIATHRHVEPRNSFKMETPETLIEKAGRII